jgi:riboflavin synthase
MFTGITEHVGKIESLELAKDGGRLRISLSGAGDFAASVGLGDSISVNGCCLTVVEFDSSHFCADLSGETLRRTSFGEKKSGDLVNLEKPLTANARLGGHFVQGHVDGIGRVTRLLPEGDNRWLSVRVPEDHPIHLRPHQCSCHEPARCGERRDRRPRKICGKPSCKTKVARQLTPVCS